MQGIPDEVCSYYAQWHKEFFAPEFWSAKLVPGSKDWEKKKPTRAFFSWRFRWWTISCENAPVFHVTGQTGAPVCTKRDERFSHPSKLHQVSDARVPANLEGGDGTGQRCVDMEDFQDEMVPERRITWINMIYQHHLDVSFLKSFCRFFSGAFNTKVRTCQRGNISVTYDILSEKKSLKW